MPETDDTYWWTAGPQRATHADGSFWHRCRGPRVGSLRNVREGAPPAAHTHDGRDAEGRAYIGNTSTAPRDMAAMRMKYIGTVYFQNSGSV